MKTVLGVLVVSALIVAGCGKSNDETAKKSPSPPRGGEPTATTPADAPFSAELEAAGWRVVQARTFPGQVPGYKATAVVYQGKKRGGVLYAVQRSDGPHVVWHWYFDDAAPDSVAPVELNDDGLWDCRVYFGKKSRDFVQGENFTLVAPVRGDRIALNGRASSPDNVWLVFDGDSTTAWVCNEKSAWIDVPVPLGVRDGVLTVRLVDTDRPGSVTVYADGKKVKSADLAPTSDRQRIELGTAVAGAGVVRVEFQADRRVAVGELSLR